MHRNPNCYTAPNDPLQKQNWLSGKENDFDKSIFDEYTKKIQFLEKMAPTSIFQLKNTLLAFWHVDRELSDYWEYKNTQIRNSNYPTTASPIDPPIQRETLENRSKRTFAKIGCFTLGEKVYDVLAFHPLGNEKRGNQIGLHSLCFGKTSIGIFQRQVDPYLYSRLGPEGENHSFNAIIGREGQYEQQTEIFSEEQDDLILERVDFKNRGYLLINDGLEYRDSVKTATGSDRKLDQFLTQIMIEVAWQNSFFYQPFEVKVTSTGDDLAVLIASGFRIESRSQLGFSSLDLQSEFSPESFETITKESLLRDLWKFRQIERNQLFPPHLDYGVKKVKFPMHFLNEESVYYEKDNSSTSFSELIRTQPILTKEAAILPERWVKTAPRGIGENS